VRKEEKVRSVSALIVSGINTKRFREILGMRSGDSETEETWKDLFRWLKGRGLKGVRQVVSDAHKGLVAAMPGKPSRISTRSFQERQVMPWGWLAEKHETWSTGKRYFDMTEYFEVLEEEEKKEIEVNIPKAS